MTELSETWKFLENVKFQINAQLSVDMQCIICNQSSRMEKENPCECIYCKICIEKVSEHGFETCPKDEHYCKKEKLVFEIKMDIDNGAKKKISKLQIQCPSSSCDFKSELIDICNHLKGCEKRENNCPYNEIGCPTIARRNDRTFKHIETNVLMYSKLLIEQLLTGQNNISSSFYSNVQDLMKYERADQFQSPQEILKSQTHFIDTKKSKKTLTHLQKLTKTDSLSTYKGQQFRMTRNNNKLMDSKIENSILRENNTQYDNHRNNSLNFLEDEIDNSFFQGKQIERFPKAENLKTKNKGHDVQRSKKTFSHGFVKLNGNVDDFAEMSDPQLEKNQLVLYMDSQPSMVRKNSDSPLEFTGYGVNQMASLKWSISSTYQLRKCGKGVESSYFYSKNNGYKMKLWMDPDSSGDGSWMKIEFFIWNGSNKKHMKWPFKGVVTMSVQNKQRRHSCQTITQNLEIEKPKDHVENEQLFYFSMSDLDQVGVFLSNSIIIECVVVSDMYN